MKQKAFPDSNPAPQPLHNHVAELGAGQDVEAHVDRSLSISEKKTFLYKWKYIYIINIGQIYVLNFKI